MLSTQQDITITSDGLTLEGVLHLPNDSKGLPGVVVCHPHPRHGGDMRSVVVTSVVQALCDAGIAALQFNFRGVGGSEGVFDNGVGEARDAVEALTWLSLHEQIDTGRVGVAGYSFGAGVALETTERTDLVHAVASIACPLRAFTGAGAGEILQPKLLVCGDTDHDFPAKQFKFLAQRFTEPKQVELLSGADHFFGGHLSEVGELVSGFFGERLGDAGMK